MRDNDGSLRSLGTLSIGSFNVRGLSSNLKREQLVKDLISYKGDICSLQETKLVNGLNVNVSSYRLDLKGGTSIARDEWRWSRTRLEQQATRNRKAEEQCKMF